MSLNEQQNHDYDTEWKSIISLLFEDFIKFFLPHMYKAIDFSQKVSFLDKEFHQIVKNKNNANGKGNSFKDKLAKVKLKLKDGLDYFILIHIEVQSSPKTSILKRMFRYFYRICDRFDWKATAIAVYTGKKVPKNYNKYTYKFFGTELTYKFNTYRVNAAKTKELLASDNPFALVVLASKYLNDSMDDPKGRLKFKIKLITLARERNYSELQIDALLTFIEYLLILPKDLELEFEQELEKEYYKTIEDMEASPHTKKLMTNLYNKFFETSIEEVKERASQADFWKLEAQQAKQEALQTKQEAEEKARKADLLTKKIIQRFADQGMTAAQIAEMLELPLDKIKKLQE